METKIERIGGVLSFDKDKNPIRFDVTIESSTVAEIQEQNIHLSEEQSLIVLEIIKKTVEKRKERKISEKELN